MSGIFQLLAHATALGGSIGISHLLILAAAVGAIMFLRPVGPVLLMFALLLYSLILAIGDLATPFTRRKSGPFTDDEYYTQFEPKPRTAILLAVAALGLYIAGWLAGAFAEPGKRPITAILIADIVLTVTGLTFCFYARMKSQTYYQTVLVWIPLCCWILHSIILLGHGVQIERMNDG